MLKNKIFSQPLGTEIYNINDIYVHSNELRTRTFLGVQETHEPFWTALEQVNVRIWHLPNRSQKLDRFIKLLRCSQNYYV